MFKPGYLWFTYRDDSEHVVESVRCARRCIGADAPILIADDAHLPVSSDIRKRLEGYGAEYEQTEWNRGGNLLGPAHLIGATELYDRFARDRKLDAVVKVDSDSMLIRDGWVKELEGHPEAVLSGAFRDQLTYVFGLAYAIRSSALPALAEDAKRVPSHFSAFEDYEVGTRLFRLNGYRHDYAVRHMADTKDGFLDVALRDANETFRFANVANFGWDYQSVPQNGKREYKERQLALMRRINDLLEKEAGNGV